MAQVNAAAGRSKDVLVGGVRALTAAPSRQEGGERAVRADPDQPAPAAPHKRRSSRTRSSRCVWRDVGFDLITFGQHFLLNEFQAIQPAIAAARLAAEAGRCGSG